MEFDIQIDEEAVVKKLQETLHNSQDMTPAMQRISRVLVDASDRAFEYETDPNTGFGWAVFASTTVEQKKQKGKWPAKILGDTGKLADSIVSDYGPDFAVAGTNKKYATTHQFGAEQGAFGRGNFKTRNGSFPIPWGDIPARPFLGIGPDDEEGIIEILRDHILGDR